MDNTNIIKRKFKHPTTTSVIEFSHTKLSGDVDFSYLQQFDQIKTLALINNDRITGILGLPDSLIKFECVGNIISCIYDLPPNLKVLKCGFNHIENFDNLISGLQILDCTHNPLIKSLDNLPSGLLILKCSECSLTSLDNLPETLESLDCSSNSISQLDNLPAGLKTLICKSNPLVNLNNLPKTLINLSCSNCELESIILPSTLIRIEIENCNLTEMPELNDGIKYCDVSNNLISFIDGTKLPKSIETFYCHYNNISQITLLDKQFTGKICCDNDVEIISELDDGVKIIKKHAYQVQYNYPNDPNNDLDLDIFNFDNIIEY